MNFEMDFVCFKSIERVEKVIDSWIQDRERLFMKYKCGILVIEKSLKQMYRQFSHARYSYSDKSFTIYPTIYALAENQLFAESKKQIERLNFSYGRMIDEILRKCG